MVKLEIIKTLCKQKGISVRKLAENLNIKQSTLQSAIDNNSTKIETLEAIANYFNVSIGIFFDEPTDKINENNVYYKILKEILYTDKAIFDMSASEYAKYLQKSIAEGKTQKEIEDNLPTEILERFMRSPFWRFMLHIQMKNRDLLDSLYKENLIHQSLDLFLECRGLKTSEEERKAIDAEIKNRVNIYTHKFR